MNITLSADEKLIAESRAYANRHNTTLNNLIREYLRQISGEKDTADYAREFAELAENMAGQSDASFRFNREELYDRL